MGFRDSRCSELSSDGQDLERFYCAKEARRVLHEADEVYGIRMVVFTMDSRND